MPKKKSVQKRVEIVLPVKAGVPVPAEIAVVPVVMSAVKVTPLRASVGPVRCVLTLKESFWAGAEYVVLSAAPGKKLPTLLKTGQEVDVHFLPPR